MIRLPLKKYTANTIGVDASIYPFVLIKMKGMIILTNIRRAKTVLKISAYTIDVLQIVVGTILMASGTAFFLLPNKLSTGGFSGIATIFYYFLNFNMGVTILVLNAPLFILACFKIGIKFLSKAIIGTILLSLFIDTFTRFGVATGDRLLASIYGGIITGIGTAIVLKANASTGGSDLLAIIIRKFKPHFRTSNLIMIIDASIVILNVIFFKQLEIALYSAIAIYLMGKVMDIFLEGIHFAKMIYIISDKNEDISKKINEDIGRGATLLYGKGMYKKEKKNVLLCVASRNEVGQISQIIKKIDKHAFTIISNAREVIGKGFKQN